jgi:hypothetical protein
VGLREQAESDLAFIIEDEAGFGWAITVTDPDGTSKDLIGLSNDIAQAIDPDTGQAVAGRTASIALRISTLVSVGLGLPKAVAEKTAKPWLVAFNDINGGAHTFKVSEVLPDRAVGLVVCILQAYQ